MSEFVVKRFSEWDRKINKNIECLHQQFKIFDDTEDPKYWETFLRNERVQTKFKEHQETVTISSMENLKEETDTFLEIGKFLKEILK
uniref:Uncharacterized protein n=1 Tax=Megaselia scalaris TaxID=36166 RepID=T1GI93_MEGSC